MMRLHQATEDTNMIWPFPTEQSARRFAVAFAGIVFFDHIWKVYVR
jgi:hypothetical protein